MSRSINNIQPYRIKFIYLILVATVCALSWRVADLQVINNDFLLGQGNARVLRQVEISAHRGMITDRNGYPLAISTPVSSIWINPEEFDPHAKHLYHFAKLLKLNSQYIKNKVEKNSAKEFVYIKRRINPNLAQQVMDLSIKGVHVQKEYRRYYPDGEIFGHLLGFTDIDDHGQEGLELAYNDWLSGNSGQKKVVKDRLGRIIAIEEQIKPPEPGKDLVLSIDRGVQYLAYKELKKAVQKNKAKSGSAVVLDIKTGEIIAMVNQPAFNPNRLSDRKSKLYRNRAVTDLFEPGSTMKPLTIAAALDSGKYTPGTLINTGNGWMMVSGKTIKDTHANGTIDVTTVLQKSSNVGTVKIALNLPKSLLWETFYSFGFGSDTGSGFPGESAGRLIQPRRIHKIEQAAISFGYGMSVTSLQLAQAYSTLARAGKKIPVGFLKQDITTAAEFSHSGIDTNVSANSLKRVSKMMEYVVQQGGTAPRAAVPGYRVAGKTGTVKKTSKQGGYTEKNYSAVFAGFAPASDPHLAMVVMVDEPSNGDYYGGLVAAPAFSSVMTGALRLMNINPDNIQQPNIAVKINEKLDDQG